MFQKLKKTDFIKDLRNIKWWPEAYTEYSLDDLVEIWEQKVKSVLERHCPLRSIDVRSNYTPWMSSDLLDHQHELKKPGRDSEIVSTTINRDM